MKRSNTQIRTNKPMPIKTTNILSKTKPNIRKKKKMITQNSKLRLLIRKRNFLEHSQICSQIAVSLNK